MPTRKARAAQRRFLICYIEPSTGRERLGTFPAGQTFARYANVANVIRFQLSLPHYPAGQYRIYAWPEGGMQSKAFTNAWKRA